MRARRLAAAAAVVLALAAGCGSGSTGGNPASSGGTGGGGGAGGTPAAGSAALAFQVQRATTSGDYTAADLAVGRVVAFSTAPTVGATGFRCEDAGGSAVDTAGTAHVDLSSPGVTPVLRVTTSASSVAELWLLVRARVTKHGNAHAAHGDLSCTAANGTLYAVLRFTPPSPVALDASRATTLTGTFDAASVHEQGDCDRACDEDDQHLDDRDPAHGRILLGAAHALDASVAATGAAPPVGPAPTPIPTPTTPPSSPTAGVTICAPGQACTCKDASSCALECPGGSCNLSCERTGGCALTCAGGGCNLSCRDAGTCSETCTGGGCRSMTCEGAGTCDFSSCGGAVCNASCTNAGVCRCDGGTCR